MRFYDFQCEKCGNVEEISVRGEVSLPSSVKCPSCGSDAKRVWGAAVIIPEHFKATSDLYGGDHGSNFDYLKNRMNHGTRPSGRGKVYY